MSPALAIRFTLLMTWREAIGLAPLERLQGLLLDGIDDEHRGRDYRAVMAGALEVGSIDGR
jgi:hypothetical protein